MNSSVEIWRKHPNIEKIEVSTLGRVRPVDGHCYKNQLNRDGYLYAHFRINGKQFNKKVHRLVAQTFMPNPDNLPQVNHKDCDKENNNVENLEWCTSKYNRQYREKYGVSQTEVLGHSAFAINLTTLEVSYFRSQREASRELGVNSGSVSKVIKGERNHTCGYWFVNDDNNAVNAVRQKLDELGKTELKAKDGTSAKLISQVMDYQSVH